MAIAPNLAAQIAAPSLVQNAANMLAGDNGATRPLCSVCDCVVDCIRGKKYCRRRSRAVDTLIVVAKRKSPWAARELRAIRFSEEWETKMRWDGIVNEEADKQDEQRRRKMMRWTIALAHAMAATENLQ